MTIALDKDASVAAIGSPPPQAAAGTLTSWMSSTSSTDHVQHVGYIGSSGGVYELYLHPGQPPWGYGAVSFPGAGGNGMTSWTSDSADTHIAFVGTDGHVHVYSKQGREPWVAADATLSSGAPNASGGALTSWVTLADNLQHIAYIDGSGHVDELYSAISANPSKWSFDEPAKTAGAPNAQGGALTSWVSSSDNLQHIAYIDGSSKVEELFVPIGAGGAKWSFDEPAKSATRRVHRRERECRGALPSDRRRRGKLGF